MSILPSFRGFSDYDKYTWRWLWVNAERICRIWITEILPMPLVDARELALPAYR
jgi:hypothetical protein